MPYGTPNLGGITDFRLMLSAPNGASLDCTIYVTVNQGGPEARDALFQDFVNKCEALADYGVMFAVRNATQTTECTPD